MVLLLLSIISNGICKYAAFKSIFEMNLADRIQNFIHKWYWVKIFLGYFIYFSNIKTKPVLSIWFFNHHNWVQLIETRRFYSSLF